MHITSNAFRYSESRVQSVSDISQIVFITVLRAILGNHKAEHETCNYTLQGPDHNTNDNTICSTSLSRKLSIRGVPLMYLLRNLTDFYSVQHFKFSPNNTQYAKTFVKVQKFLLILK